MYPIPADRKLNLWEIADHWSREISPSRTKGELFDDLAMAWWRGEFQSRTEITRLNALRALFQTQRAELPFWVEGSEMPQTIWEHPDGSVDLLLLPPIPVPRTDPEAWVDGECLSAFDTIAQNWPHEAFNIVNPAVMGVILTSQDFAGWVANFGYTPPTFWASSPRAVAELPPIPVQPPQKNTTGRHLTFVKQYIRDTEAAGKLPTNTGLEAAARSAGLRGGRDARRREFKKQMGVNAPGRGRPKK